MTSPTATDAKNLIDLAERLGIPSDAAIRQVGRIVSDPDRRPEPAEGPKREAAEPDAPVVEADARH